MSGNDFAPGPYLNPPPMTDDGGGGEALKDVSNIAPVPPAPDAQQAGNPRAQAPVPQMTPQAAQVQHHAALGKIASTLLGYDTTYKADPNTGQITAVQTPQPAGSFFRRILAGALLGGVAGAAPSYDAHGNVIRTPFNSAMKGAAGAMQYNQQQKQAGEDQSFKQAQANLTGQQRQQQLGVEKDKLASELEVNKATVAYHTAQTLALQKDSDMRTEKWHAEQNAMSAAAVEGIKKVGGVPAQISLPDGTTANGTMTMQQALDAQTAAHKQGRDITQPPDQNHVRMFYSFTDHSELHWNGQHYVDDSGKAVDLDPRKTIQAFDVPLDQMKQEHPYSIAELRKFVPGFSPNSKPTDVVQMNGYAYMQFQAQGVKTQREKAQAEEAAAAPGQKALQLDIEGKRVNVEAWKARQENNTRQLAVARADQQAVLHGQQDVVTNIGKAIESRQQQLKELDAEDFDAPNKEQRRAQLTGEIENLHTQYSTASKQLEESTTRYQFETHVDGLPKPAKPGALMPVKDFQTLAEKAGGSIEAATNAAKAKGWRVTPNVVKQAQAAMEKSNSTGSKPQQPVTPDTTLVKLNDGRTAWFPKDKVDQVLKENPGSQILQGSGASPTQPKQEPHKSWIEKLRDQFAPSSSGVSSRTDAQHEGILGVTRQLVAQGQTRDQIRAHLVNHFGGNNQDADLMMQWLDKRGAFQQSSQQLPNELP